MARVPLLRRGGASWLGTTWPGLLLALAVALWAGVALGQEEEEPEGPDVTAEVEAGELGDPEPSSDIHDPFEKVNRGIFRFNEGLDRWVVEPIAVAWDFVLPDPVQTGISNFYENTRFPIVFVNNLLQWKPKAAAQDVGRFLVNTVMGAAGFLDPASTLPGLPLHDEDFGQTFGKWGIPEGPYLMLPLLGPSTPRDGVGLAFEAVGRIYSFFIPFYVSLTITAGDLLNRRSMLIDEIREERQAAFDYYAFVRNAYLSYRRNQVRDREDEPAEADDDLYNLFEDDDEENP